MQVMVLFSETSISRFKISQCRHPDRCPNNDGLITNFLRKALNKGMSLTVTVPHFSPVASDYCNLLVFARKLSVCNSLLE